MKTILTRMYRKSDQKLLTTYSVTLLPSPHGVCKPVSNLRAVREDPTLVTVTWDNPVDGAVPHRRVLQIRRWDSSSQTWKYWQSITEPPTNTKLWHGGRWAHESHAYAYTMVTECVEHGARSLPSEWVVVGTPSRSAQQGPPDGGSTTPTPPTPTPTPTSTPTQTEEGVIEERPPSPR